MYRINIVLEKETQAVLKNLKKKMHLDYAAIIQIALHELTVKLAKEKQINYKNFFRELIEKTNNKEYVIIDGQELQLNNLEDQL